MTLSGAPEGKLTLRLRGMVEKAHAADRNSDVAKAWADLGAEVDLYFAPIIAALESHATLTRERDDLCPILCRMIGHEEDPQGPATLLGLAEVCEQRMNSLTRERDAQSQARYILQADKALLTARVAELESNAREAETSYHDALERGAWLDARYDEAIKSHGRQLTGIAESTRKLEKARDVALVERDALRTQLDEYESEIQHLRDVRIPDLAKLTTQNAALREALEAAKVEMERRWNLYSAEQSKADMMEGFIRDDDTRRSTWEMWRGIREARAALKVAPRRCGYFLAADTTCVLDAGHAGEHMPYDGSEALKVTP